MTDEEKEAIEIFKNYINAIDTFGTISPKCCNNLYEPAETILNLIQKQEKEIQLSNKVIDKRNQEKLELAEMLLKKDKIIDDAINEIESLRQYFSEDLQPEFIGILEILKDKKVLDW
jgi:hypothetical protein